MQETSNLIPKTPEEKLKVRTKQTSQATPPKIHIHLALPVPKNGEFQKDKTINSKKSNGDPIAGYVGNAGPVAAPRLYRAHFRQPMRAGFVRICLNYRG